MGEWKLNTVIGKNHKQALVTIVERSVSMKVIRKTSTCVVSAIIALLTFSSWERRLNENTNGLIHQYFPKKYCFTAITQQQVQRLMDKLNNHPRKCLGFKTPNEIFFGVESSAALTS
ncbi:hypothetical protein MNBD_GAMMA12-1845 [hydrothermal vent metagenome]|uniref:Mobile element protein n=1 Tax=hydrothermal vent metagenome TaxID=652676 RepID=A0A3B0YJ70_9ZZZZ